MKNQTKAVIASIVVIALALTAVSGITYSWFSDSEKANITVSTAVVDYKATFNTGTPTNMTISGENGVYTISNLAANASGTITCNVTNKSTIDTKYKVMMTPTLEKGHTITDYDLRNVTIKVGENSISFIDEKGSVKDVIISDWTNAAAPKDHSVGNDIKSIEIEISTPLSYGGDPENPADIEYTDENGEKQKWDAQTVRSGLTLEFKVIAVQDDYSTTP